MTIDEKTMRAVGKVPESATHWRLWRCDEHGDNRKPVEFILEDDTRAAYLPIEQLSYDLISQVAPGEWCRVTYHAETANGMPSRGNTRVFSTPARQREAPAAQAPTTPAAPAGGALGALPAVFASLQGGDHVTALVAVLGMLEAGKAEARREEHDRAILYQGMLEQSRREAADREARLLEVFAKSQAPAARAVVDDERLALERKIARYEAERGIIERMQRDAEDAGEELPSWVKALGPMIEAGASWADKRWNLSGTANGNGHAPPRNRHNPDDDYEDEDDEDEDDEPIETEGSETT